MSCIICISSCYTNGNEAGIYIKQICTNLATELGLSLKDIFLVDIFELYYMLMYLSLQLPELRTYIIKKSL